MQYCHSFFFGGGRSLDLFFWGGAALKVIIENDKRHYPETTCHAFVVNAPGIVTVAWDILSPILDKKTRDKVQIIGGGTRAPVVGTGRGLKRWTTYGASDIRHTLFFFILESHPIV